MTTILFVCFGNTCRSPMAAAIFQSMLSDHSEARGWTIASAGTWANAGAPATENAQVVMRARGLDIQAHQARRVSGEMLTSADLVVVMERNQKEALQVEFPGVSERVWMLTELAGTKGDVEDPIGKPLVRFRQTADELERLLKRALLEILARSAPREEGKTGTA
ncbi:MAG: low molecular weight protein arginine phosphatase [Anaerolineaceae bacterium]|nr:low molecular weight protein arginine phosphatase [Anaerolineaceae bacterium]